MTEDPNQESELFHDWLKAQPSPICDAVELKIVCHWFGAVKDAVPVAIDTTAHLFSWEREGGWVAPRGITSTASLQKARHNAMQRQSLNGLSVTFITLNVYFQSMLFEKGHLGSFTEIISIFFTRSLIQYFFTNIPLAIQGIQMTTGITRSYYCVHTS